MLVTTTETDYCAKNDCDVNANCINRELDYECVCKEGFHGRGTWCEKGTCFDRLTCPQNQECETSTGVDCKCKSGFERASNNSCVDVNECEIGTHQCTELEECVNTNGNYKCHCINGYAKKAWHGLCGDINECKTGDNRCSELEKCVNTKGSYTCRCRFGFERASDDSCVDVNECETGVHQCSELEHCHNTIGSFECYKGKLF